MDKGGGREGGGMPAPLFHNQYDKYFSSQKVQQLQKRVGEIRTPDPAGCPILFTAIER